MKLKSFIAVAALVFLAACSTTYRATDTGVVIPADAQRAFDDQYPNVTNVVWRSYSPNVVILNDWELSGWEVMEADDYTVEFYMDGEKHYAFYDQYGNWIGTAYVVNDYGTLPSSITNTINSQYSGYSISSVNKEYHKDRTAYEIVMKNSDSKVVLLMDLNGNIIKSKMKPL